MTLSGVEWVRAPSGVEGLALAATAEKAETPKAGRLKSEDHVAADSIAYTDECCTFGYPSDPRNPR